ncbi:hypothetical protein DFJ73DRAFT_760700 [Zopfochytrium polystomum]|nr:hypothetical protein DFJ73DRAFT_760700 [Zopfochytrium polystomum]
MNIETALLVYIDNDRPGERSQKRSKRTCRTFKVLDTTTRFVAIILNVLIEFDTAPDVVVDGYSALREVYAFGVSVEPLELNANKTGIDVTLDSIFHGGGVDGQSVWRTAGVRAPKTSGRGKRFSGLLALAHFVIAISTKMGAMVGLDAG